MESCGVDPGPVESCGVNPIVGVVEQESLQRYAVRSENKLVMYCIVLYCIVLYCMVYFVLLLIKVLNKQVSNVILKHVHA